MRANHLFGGMQKCRFTSPAEQRRTRRACSSFDATALTSLFEAMPSLMIFNRCPMALRMVSAISTAADLFPVEVRSAASSMRFAPRRA